jgi:ABC-type multidrug transport system ATPase subunit
MACIKACRLRKTYGKTLALDGINLQVDGGRILGLIV